MEENTITFSLRDEKEPVMKMCKNGDIYIRGKLTTNDMEVVEGMREFLATAKKERT